MISVWWLVVIIVLSAGVGFLVATLILPKNERLYYDQGYLDALGKIESGMWTKKSSSESDHSSVWICPKCGRVNAYWVSTCSCWAPEIITSDKTGLIYTSEEK